MLLPQDHPNPIFCRQRWLSLNGKWDFAFDDDNLGVEHGWPFAPEFPLRIEVPFPYQSSRSGINEKGVHPWVWYGLNFAVPQDWLGEDVLIHFGAVDYLATVWINGQAVGSNRGGHVPFSFDITPCLIPGENRLVVRVEDTLDPHQPRGKQSKTGQPYTVYYPCTTGIWQTVWLEPAPHLRIDSIRTTPASELDGFILDIYLHGPASEYSVEIRAAGGGGPATPPLKDVSETDELRDLASDPRVTKESSLGHATNGRAIALFDNGNGRCVRADARDLANLAASADIDSQRGSWVLSDKVIIHQFEGAAACFFVPIENARLWSPEEPHLYQVRITLKQDGEVLDEVLTYVGIRSIKLKQGHVMLNGEPIYLKMVLDQGYWPESLIAAPADEALRADVQWAKALGFNGARKHQKIEDPRWLYWCDRLGLLVFGEMPNAKAWSPEAEEKFVQEWARAIERDVSHPCIVAWVPFNESWGLPNLADGHHRQHAFVEKVVALTRRLDQGRPIIGNDGWEQPDVTDICSIHDYSPSGKLLAANYGEMLEGRGLPHCAWPEMGKPVFTRGALHRGQPVMLTEVGGFLFRPQGVTLEELDACFPGYGAIDSYEELVERYRELVYKIASLPFVCGFCYTQLCDVEQEENGFLTYARKPKVDPEAIRSINTRLGDLAAPVTGGDRDFNRFSGVSIGNPQKGG